MIIHFKKIIPLVIKGHYGLGAFNTANLETTEAILVAANSLRSPVIIQVSEKTINYAGLETITNLIWSVDRERKIKVPVVMHLDHGHSLEVIKRAIAVGFSSVHIDASELPFEQNISLCRQAVSYARRRGVWVQGELGSILGKEGLVKLARGLRPENYMTDPTQVQEFIQRTGVDTLAISVGTMHGSFRGREKIDLKRLAAIHRLIPNPLVLHGASGNRGSEIKQAIKSGIRIINIDTDMRLAFTRALRQTLARKMDLYDPRQILRSATEAVAKVVAEKIKIFGSAGRIKN